MKHPIDDVVWIHRDELKPNSYNPNHVARPELNLLKLSILEDGFTQPIVVGEDNVIIDGFHRWKLSGTKELIKMTNSRVPIVRVDKPLANRMLSTIRHNRARGVHNVLDMGKISQYLQKSGLSNEEIMHRLGMGSEELGRLTDNVTMFEDHGHGEFGKSWLPVFEEDATEGIL